VSRSRFSITRAGQLVQGAPPVASERQYLRAQLPALYRDPDGDFGQRFVSAFELPLDASLAILDALPAYFDADLAPTDLLELIASWVGIELDESWPEDRRRELVRAAGRLGQLRGTRAGLELVLGIAFPELSLEVKDAGSVRVGAETEKPAPEASFAVNCRTVVSEQQLAGIVRLVQEIKPVHVQSKLRVRSAPPGGTA
jgi:phage tail-like protein